LSLTTARQTAIHEGAQMIPFPLMTIWMWFQILEASPNLAFVPHRRRRQQRCDLLATRPFEGG
jgi:hypothetical protein